MIKFYYISVMDDEFCIKLDEARKVTEFYNKMKEKGNFFTSFEEAQLFLIKLNNAFNTIFKEAIDYRITNEKNTIGGRARLLRDSESKTSLVKNLQKLNRNSNNKISYSTITDFENNVRKDKWLIKLYSLYFHIDESWIERGTK
ncbi:hypothetical protein QQA45_04660 [Sneathia sanguinegens]|uniref:Uncharacterized protein n=1 Tax=Sneathia sanguinegens TaxID=40543 RepID=A0ABT7HJX0_9FUSO|nr:hypothetical protein [Sneathia sanguinegens]MDK9580806.1 hypothetical protein [Sneathia sanguinegens]